MRHVRLSLSVFFLLPLVLASCQSPEPDPGSVTWLVQATDPHVFEKPPEAGEKEKDKASRRYQEQRNREAFQSLLGTLQSLPGSGASADYLVITGDFGFGEEEEKSDQGPTGDARGASVTALPTEDAADVTETPIPAGPTPGCGATGTREGRVACLACLLKASPMRDLDVVPGNNDVKKEMADKESLSAYQLFLSDVEKATEGRVTIHDLTRCYLEGAPLSQCWTDIPGTAFRLVGFPSHSFKSEQPPKSSGSGTV